jgi:hypothetical protein
VVRESTQRIDGIFDVIGFANPYGHLGKGIQWIGRHVSPAPTGKGIFFTQLQVETGIKTGQL